MSLDEMLPEDFYENPLNAYELQLALDEDFCIKEPYHFLMREDYE